MDFTLSARQSQGGQSRLRSIIGITSENARLIASLDRLVGLVSRTGLDRARRPIVSTRHRERGNRTTLKPVWVESRRQFPNFSRWRPDLAATAEPHAPTNTPPASPDPPAIPNPASRLPFKRNQAHRAELNDFSQGYLCKRRERIPGKWDLKPVL